MLKLKPKKIKKKEELMKIEKRKISELIKAEYNPRKISVVQLYELKEGIEEFGLVEPLVVNENPERKNIIVGGHQRLKIWEELGNIEVDCSIVNLPLDKERKLNIKLNKNGGTFDDDLLQEFFEYEELIEWGFTPDELFDKEEKTDGLIEDDEIPEVKESKVKIGDVWQLGNHRLMCGDSTSSDNVAKLMNGEKADMVFTDPPYGIDVVANSPRLRETKKLGSIGKGVLAKEGKYKPVRGDEDTSVAKKFIELIKDIDCIIWGGNYFTDVLKPSRGWIVWDKKNGDTTFADAELAYTTFDKSVRVYEFLWSGMRRKGNRKDESKFRLHPTQKPVGLFENIIKDWCKDKKNILDGFLGSGSTLIACEKTNKICYGMELDEHYCDVIIERWEQFTGLKAEKING
jgi:DNA modification methylase